MLEKYFSQYFINLRLLTNISIHKCSGNNVRQSITYKQQNKIKVSYLKQASCYFFLLKWHLKQMNSAEWF